ncbi:MAG: ThiF family adenylyltransferase, partial [Nanoarchaeota archaeon]|nr:ThiF family adenylyltransferase [Nanoarchaeota archaeon]
MRYKYQTLFSEIGEKGQKELEKKTVTIVGVGGVGSAVAMFLARSGVNLRLVDKDRVYEDELQRQAIYTEDQINKF